MSVTAAYIDVLDLPYIPIMGMATYDCVEKKLFYALPSGVQCLSVRTPLRQQSCFVLCRPLNKTCSVSHKMSTNNLLGLYPATQPWPNLRVGKNFCEHPVPVTDSH